MNLKATVSRLRTRLGLTGLLLAGLVLFTGGPALADWIVLQGGERLETRGPWQVRGSRVLFTNTSGALVSLRLSEVDMEATRAAGIEKPAEQKDTPAKVKEAPRAPVLILDDTNVSRARSRGTAAAATEASTATSTEAGPGELRLASWQETAAGANGLRFNGMLENPTQSFAVLVAVRAVLSDDEGNVIDSATGSMPAASVGPGETQTFEVVFPNTFAYSAVEFEVSSKMLRTRNDQDEPPASTSSEGSSDDPPADSTDNSAADTTAASGSAAEDSESSPGPLVV